MQTPKACDTFSLNQTERNATGFQLHIVARIHTFQIGKVSSPSLPSARAVGKKKA